MNFEVDYERNAYGKKAKEMRAAYTNWITTIKGYYDDLEAKKAVYTDADDLTLINTMQNEIRTQVSNFNTYMGG